VPAQKNRESLGPLTRKMVTHLAGCCISLGREIRNRDELLIVSSKAVDTLVERWILKWLKDSRIAHEVVAVQL
jgi:hypothetical protein